VAVTFRLEQGVTFAYPGGAVVLRDLDLHLENGRTIAVLGRSGLGKTTLLNLLALLWDRGLVRGRIVYTSPRTGKSVPYSELTGDEQARLRREEFGLVPQVSHFLSGFTCGQNLRIPLSLQGTGSKQARARIEQLLKTVAHADSDVGTDLGALLSKYPAQVSTGQRQRLSVLRAIAHDPVVLFADEPVSNLDAENKAKMVELFRLWRDNKLRLPDQPEQHRTLLLICHEAETAWELADDYLFLRPPHKDESPGATAELLTHQALCELNGLSPNRDANRFEAAEAIRRHIAGLVPAGAPAAPGLLGGELS
jgi:putative ABC transport system ATP-binding protein